MDDETYVRRRRWSMEEKRAVVTEALSSGNVIATAKRHGIQAQQFTDGASSSMGGKVSRRFCLFRLRRIRCRSVRHRCWTIDGWTAHASHYLITARYSATPCNHVSKRISPELSVHAYSGREFSALSPWTPNCCANVARALRAEWSQCLPSDGHLRGG